jgi:hypothetical protein
MTKRDFLIMSIRLISMSLTIYSLMAIGPILMTMLGAKKEIWGDILLVVVLSMALIAFTLLISIHTPRIVDIFKLTSNFDDDRIDFGNLDQPKIIQVAMVIAGGILVSLNLANTIAHTVFSFKSSVDMETYPGQDYVKWTITSLNVIIGFILIAKNKAAAKLLIFCFSELKDNKNEGISNESNGT